MPEMQSASGELETLWELWRTEMKVGFTGTRHGMTHLQREAFIGELMLLDMHRFHHGACAGADAYACAAVVDGFEGVAVTAHPGRSARGGENELCDLQSLAESHEVRETKTHFARNRDIVNETDMLIATPYTMTDRDKGGTWYTINYAIKAGKPVCIIAPDGTIERHNADAGSR